MPKSLLTFAPVELQKALFVQEGKLIQQNGAEQKINHIKENIKAIEVKKSIKIVAHNINGLKGNRHKLEILVDKFEEEEYDMIGILEMNILEKEGHFIIRHRENIDSFWTDAEKGKSKGSGVDIIISQKWSKHIGQVRKHSRYLLEVHFFFKQFELVVFIVYMAPNN